MRSAAALECVVRVLSAPLARVALAAMILLAAAEPLSRWLGISGAPFDEGATSTFFALTMLSFGYAYVAGAHVRLDFASRRFTARTRAAIELSGVVSILLPLCVLVMMDASESAWRSFEQGERWAGTTIPMQWLVRASVAVGFFLLALAGIAAALRAVSGLLRR